MFNIFIITVVVFWILALLALFKLKTLKEIENKPNVLGLSKMFSAAWATILSLDPPFVETELTNKILATLTLDRLLHDSMANHAHKLIN